VQRDCPNLPLPGSAAAATTRCVLNQAARKLIDGFDQKVFDAIYSRSLVYNTCWEDAAVDRQALLLTPRETALVITSAGCNSLDYALLGPARIHAVDANPRQNALLALKIAGIRALDHADYFQLFGHGRHPRFRALYGDVLRRELSEFAQGYWDRNGEWFCQKDARDTFYYYGLSGLVARAFRAYLRVRPRLRESIEAMFQVRSLEAQRDIYDRRVEPLMWSKGMKWTLSRQLTLSMLGVPHAQRKEVERQHPLGVAGFIREAIEYVTRHLPIWTNYFWALYLRGSYMPECCPEYLKRENFLALKGGLVDRITMHTTTVTGFLNGTEERISRFVLLDHMDWMSSHHPLALAEEWHAILARAAQGARVICRSAHAEPAYLQDVTVASGGRRRLLNEMLQFHPDLARELTRQDRVHTYAGFHIADVGS
jgi:S-adenosylmethionine-diacylglycerol 3-amino-3-carboxypropyl transferase